MNISRIFAALFALWNISVPAFARPRLGGGGAPDISFARVTAALVLCLIVAVLAALLLKRGGGKVDLASLRTLLKGVRDDRRIDVIETRRISQHAEICIVRCDDREYVILSAQQQQMVLHDAVALAPAAKETPCD